MLISGMALLFAFGTLPFWGMGPAVLLDSSRTIISKTTSPDGRRSAQVERMTVGGVPNIVVVVRSWWLPNWYITGCAAVSHYGDANAQVRWTSNKAIAVAHAGDQLNWDIGSAPFHNAPCEDLTVTLADKP
jgi:hypothetical protein